jgi:hypothetical protein
MEDDQAAQSNCMGQEKNILYTGIGHRVRHLKVDDSHSNVKISK